MKSIVVWGLGLYKWLEMPFLNELKSKEGAKIHFICSTPQSVKHWKDKDRGGIIDSFITTNHFFYEYDNCTVSLEEACRKARYYEDKYNTFVVDALKTDRHLGRGFSSGGIGHPKSELSDKASYLKSVNMEVFEEAASGSIGRTAGPKSRRGVARTRATDQGTRRSSAGHRPGSAV